MGAAFVSAQKGCQEVPLSKCGTDFSDSCLQCGTASDYDCTKCCPKCSMIKKGDYSYCDCKSTLPPGPPAGNDTWANYEVAGMDVISVTGGQNNPSYSKVVIMLHGGGGDGTNWEYQYSEGWFGDLTGFKYVFPTSARSGHTWYQDYK